MSALKRAVCEEGFHYPSHELIPELMVFGELTNSIVMLQTGDLVNMMSIKYKGMRYAMKVVLDGRWYNERQ